MKKYKLLLILSNLLFGLNVLACKCPPKTLEKARLDEMEISDFIVIANVSKSPYINETYEKQFEVKIEEVIKGSIFEKSDTIIYLSLYCGSDIDTGMTLLYLSVHDSKIRVNSCGLSRSINFPERHPYFKSPPPMPPKLKGNPIAPLLYQDSIYNDSVYSEYLNQTPDTKEHDKRIARAELDYELKLLRENFK